MTDGAANGRPFSHGTRRQGLHGPRGSVSVHAFVPRPPRAA